jgi:hypothetical protein
LLKDETIRPDAVRLFRSRPPNWRNPLAEKDGQPGVAFRWLEVTGPMFDEWPTKGHRLMFGDLPIKKNAKGQIEVVSSNPRADAAALLRNFVQRAYRHSTPQAMEEDTQRFLKLVDASLKNFLQQSGSLATSALMFPSALQRSANQTNKDVDTRSRRHSPFSTLNSQFFCSEQPAW